MLQIRSGVHMRAPVPGPSSEHSLTPITRAARLFAPARQNVNPSESRRTPSRSRGTEPSSPAAPLICRDTSSRDRRRLRLRTPRQSRTERSKPMRPPNRARPVPSAPRPADRTPAHRRPSRAANVRPDTTPLTPGCWRARLRNRPRARRSIRDRVRLAGISDSA